MKTYHQINYYFRYLITLPIRVYQKLISPLLGERCKYYPSCSTYAVGAIMAKGVIGIFFTAWRLLRCNPWSHGGVDYPPKPLNNNSFYLNNRVGVN
jgi:putative membrane protein insertion efficiency factor